MEVLPRGADLTIEVIPALPGVAGLIPVPLAVAGEFTGLPNQGALTTLVLHHPAEEAVRDTGEAADIAAREVPVSAAQEEARLEEVQVTGGLPEVAVSAVQVVVCDPVAV